MPLDFSSTSSASRSASEKPALLSRQFWATDLSHEKLKLPTNRAEHSDTPSRVSARPVRRVVEIFPSASVASGAAVTAPAAALRSCTPVSVPPHEDNSVSSLLTFAVAVSGRACGYPHRLTTLRLVLSDFVAEEKLISAEEVERKGKESGSGKVSQPVICV